MPSVPWNCSLFTAGQSSQRGPQDYVRSHTKGPPMPDSADTHSLQKDPHFWGQKSSKVNSTNPSSSWEDPKAPAQPGILWGSYVSTQTRPLLQVLELIQLGKEKCPYLSFDKLSRNIPGTHHGHSFSFH